MTSFLKQLTHPLAWLFWLALCITSCSKTENAPIPDLKKSYYPLKLNSSITYKADSTVYDRFTRTTTSYKFQIKDTVLAEVEVGNGKTFYIERYKRLTPASPWVLQKIVTKSVIDLRVEEFIENRRYVRMVFPPDINRSWNGNTYNNLEKQEYTYKFYDTRETVNAITFDSTALVVQMDEKNLLEENYAEELYARNYGLIKKHVKAIEKNFTSQVVEHGYIYTMEFLSSTNQ